MNEKSRKQMLNMEFNKIKGFLIESKVSKPTKVSNILKALEVSKRILWHGSIVLVLWFEIPNVLLRRIIETYGKSIGISIFIAIIIITMGIGLFLLDLLFCFIPKFIILRKINFNQSQSGDGSLIDED